MANFRPSTVLILKIRNEPKVCTEIIMGAVKSYKGERVRWIFRPCFISIEGAKREPGPWLPANEVDGRFPLTSGSNLECKEFQTTKGDHRRSAEWNPLWPLRSSIEERQEDRRLISVLHSTQVSTTHYNNLTGLDLVLQDFLYPRRDASLRLLSALVQTTRYFDLKENSNRAPVTACKYIVKQKKIRDLFFENQREGNYLL